MLGDENPVAAGAAFGHVNKKTVTGFFRQKANADYPS
jgi:hypothetical protein